MRTQIIYEDEAVLVCNKPAGIAVQAASSFQSDVESELKNYIYQTEKKAEPYLGVVHRLDQPVEGLLVFAKTKEAAASLSGQLADGRLKKTYLAVLCGIPEEKEGTKVNYIKKEKSMAKIVSMKTPDAKRAQLNYRIISDYEDDEREYALAEIEIQTGRFHQIRVQMSHMGYPIAGDQKYGTSAIEKKAGMQLALCANRLEFIHPTQGKLQKYEIKPQNPLFQNFDIV